MFGGGGGVRGSCAYFGGLKRACGFVMGRIVAFGCLLIFFLCY
jgi:hypothetical protein